MFHVRYTISFGSVQKPISAGHDWNTCCSIIPTISFIHFEVITAVVGKTVVLWIAILCSYIDRYRRFGKHSILS
jgi:hypothetical protein